MVISEFMEALNTAFPRHRDEIAGLAGSYQRVLGKLGPSDLRKAWEWTIDRWERTTPPRPAEFAKHAPQSGQSGASSEDRELGARARLTRAAQAEQKALVTRTVELYADLIARHAEQHPARHKAYEMHVIAEIRKAAWPHAVATAQGQPPLRAIELTAAMLQSAHDRVYSQCRMPSGNIRESLEARSDPAREAQRARLKDLAERFRARDDEAPAA